MPGVEDSSGRALRAGSLLLLLAVSLLVLPGSARPGALADTVTITDGPSGETTSTTAAFSFVGTGAVTHFRCGLDTRVLSPCTSPTAYRDLALGAHTFTVAGYRGEIAVGVSASRDWTIIPPTPGPPAPPPPPTPPQAVLSPAAQAVAPGALAVLDGTATAGPLQELQYDLDGNGAFETKCGGTQKAGVIFTTPGTYTVGLAAQFSTGPASATSAQVTVAGSSPPPAGSTALGAKTTLVGGCLTLEPVAAAAKLYACPSTVVVGAAEATFPPGSPAGSCFQREVLGGSPSLERFVAPAGQTVLVNGLRIQPSKGSPVTIISTLQVIGVAPGTARVAVSLAHPAVDLDSGYGPLSWNVAKPGTVGELALGGFDDTFLGLKLPELKSPVVLSADRRARLKLRLKLPKPIERASGELQLTTDNTVGPVIEAFTLQVNEIPLGPLTLESVKASYHADGNVDVWDGSFKLRLPPVGPGPTVASSLEARNGLLTKLAVEMKKESPGWGPIACCVYMTRLKGSYSGPDAKVSSHYAIGAETDLTAGPKILGWSLLKLTAAGRLHWHPDFGAMLEVDGKMFLAEKFSIATASLQAKMGSGNTWIWFQGTATWDMIVFTAKGTVSGEIGDWTGKSSGTWALSGGVDLCVKFVKLCAGGKVAAATKGVSGCLYFDTGYGGIAAGGVYYWNGIWSTFWGCSKEQIQGKVGALELAAATAEAAAPTVTIPAGMRSYLVKVAGVGGAPRVALIGPTGRRIVTPAEDEPTTDRKSWLAVAVSEENATYVDIGRPQAGAWRIELLPGSVPIRSIGVAKPLPRRIVKALVVGKGEQRILRYEVEPAAGQQVELTEVGADVRRALGMATGTSGEIAFSPADGLAGTRTIEARILRDGLVIRTEVVARFRAGGSGLPAPKVSLTRRGAAVRVRWLPVAAASEYLVRTSVTDGRLLVSRLAGRAGSTSIPTVTARDGVTVSVMAVSSGGRAGRESRVRLAPLPTVAVPRTLTAAGLLRAGGFTIRCALPGDGQCAASAVLGGRTVARGKASGRYGQLVSPRLRLTAAGRAALRAQGGRALRLTVDVPGEGVRRLPLALR